jgi:hypothetical protein
MRLSGGRTTGTSDSTGTSDRGRRAYETGAGATVNRA